MARVTKPLNDTQIKNAKPKAKEYNLSDGQGLALRVKPSGAKQWLFNYTKPFTKARTNIGFGTYPHTSLEQARQKRLEARTLLEQDKDPKEHRESEQSALEAAHRHTLEHIAAQWFEIKKGQITPAYADDIWQSFQLHLFPYIGQFPLHKLTAPKTIEVLNPIAAKGNFETVKRLCQRLNEVMTYAVNAGILANNPIAAVSKAFPAPSKTHMPTIKPEQLPEMLKTLARASIKFTTRSLIEWQLHTMTRPSEAAGTRWDEIDINASLWNIPPERMKKKRAHSIPLTPQTLAILDEMRPISGHLDFVFPSDRNPKASINAQTANMAIKRMGYGGILVAHGLRALASATLNEQGFDADIIEAALAHVDGNDVRRAYNRAEYLERRRVMMAWWSSNIQTGGQ